MLCNEVGLWYPLKLEICAGYETLNGHLLSSINELVIPQRLSAWCGRLTVCQTHSESVVPTTPWTRGALSGTTLLDSRLCSPCPRIQDRRPCCRCGDIVY